MLTFLSPAFLIGVLAAAVPLVLHLLKREPEPRVKFPAVALLKRAPVEHTEKRRLRELLLLSLRVAALAMLAIAFARPFVASTVAGTPSGATIIALDTSYSMSAPGTFDRAKALARSAIARAGSGDAVGVVTFSDSATLVAKVSFDHALALSAIDAAAAGFGATRYRGALGAAVQALGGRRGAVVVVTDLQESGWEAGDRVAVPEAVRVEVVDVGPVHANLAVTALRVDDDRLLASIRNSGETPRDASVHLTIDGRPAGDAHATVEARGVVELEFRRATKGSTAMVAVDDADGLASDNVRYAVLDSANRPSVLIVTASGDLRRDGFYVQQALSAISRGGTLYQSASAAPAALSQFDGSRSRDYAVVVLLSTRGLERRGREALTRYVRKGGGLLIAAGPEVDGEIAADLLGADQPLQITGAEASQSPRSLVPSDIRHPVFGAFRSDAATLGLVTFRSVTRVGGAGCTAIARWTTGEAALIDCPAGDGRAIVIASDFDNRGNDFPRRATFVPFLHETIRYLAGGRAPEDDYLVGEVPRGVPARPGVATVPPTGSAPGRQVSVNVDPRESDLTRQPLEQFQRAAARLKDVGVSDAKVDSERQEDRQHLWMYALVLMLAMLAVEGTTAARTG